MAVSAEHALAHASAWAEPLAVVAKARAARMPLAVARAAIPMVRGAVPAAFEARILAEAPAEALRVAFEAEVLAEALAEAL